MLKEPGRTDSETRILEFLRDVDDGVRILERRFAEISAAYRRKNIALTIKFLAAGMVWMTPVDPDVKHTVTALIGSLSTFDYLTAREEVVAEKAKLRSERFYVPWSVFAHA